jgi:iron-sulfur cluster assembly protein
MINIDSGLLNITDQARVHILNNVFDEPDSLSVVGVRVGIKGGGCSGLSYSMDYMTKEDITSNDTIIKFGNDFGAYLDAKCIFYLSGVTLDYEEGLNGKGFVFQNPHATNTCGCGESFSL